MNCIYLIVLDHQEGCEDENIVTEIYAAFTEEKNAVSFLPNIKEKINFNSLQNPQLFITKIPLNPTQIQEIIHPTLKK